MTNFQRLTTESWRQFSHVDIDLSHQVTILTGQNGCGKTTILSLLSRHFGWNMNFVSTPFIGKRTAQRLWSDIFDASIDDIEEQKNGQTRIGVITYENDVKCELFVNDITGAQYHPEYKNIQSVEGLHIPSHRPFATYNAVTNIPTEPIPSTQQYQQFQQLMIQAFGGSRGENPGRVQKSSLISLALLGEGNSHVAPNAEMKRVFSGFQKVLRQVLPDSLGFERLEIRMPEVVLVTKTGTFALDAMSGGIGAIFSIAWQIHMFGHDKEKFSITIDEPENHLHPSMQRTLLPKFARAFPKCKIIAATHSPFVVSSFAQSNVVALVQDENRKVRSEKLDLRDISGTPNEVLREILDVKSNLPVWIEDRIEKIVSRAEKINEDRRAEYVLAQLEKLGIADSIVEYKRRKPRAIRH